MQSRLQRAAYTNREHLLDVRHGGNAARTLKAIFVERFYDRLCNTPGTRNARATSTELTGADRAMRERDASSHPRVTLIAVRDATFAR